MDPITAASSRGFIYVLPDGARGKHVSAIEVGPFPEADLAQELDRFFGTQIAGLTRIDAYILVHPDGLAGLEGLLRGAPFVDPITHRAALNGPLALQLGIPFDYILQSMLLPGTSDAEGTIALGQAFRALGMKPDSGDAGFRAQQYFLAAENMTPERLRAIADFLANPELFASRILSRSEYEAGSRIHVPIVTLKPDITVEEFDVAQMSGEGLLELNTTRKLAASLEELLAFQRMYRDGQFIAKRRESGLTARATDVELETWFGLRSEHCFHKEFNARITLEDRAEDPVFASALQRGWLARNGNGQYVVEDGVFKRFIEEPARNISEKLRVRGNNWMVSMFEDNSGVVRYDDNFMIAIKFETHNSPSQIEPIQGAKTGIDGVNRDIFGTMLGTFDALANFFFYCTGDPDYGGWLPAGVKHPYVILKGITRGVREGGNEMQIPTLNGGLITDLRYMAKCLVYCGTAGWSPVASADGKSYTSKHPSHSDLVFVAGQAVGIDGVHGATESSLSAGAHISLGHVQADFSFIQAKLKGYILDVARSLLLTSITDMGAMGLGSASHETARSTGGLELDLALHPRKYSGINPWQINCSETQDRMLLVAPPEHEAELLRRAALHDVQVTRLGHLTDSGYIHLTYGGKTVALFNITMLFDKEPRRRMHAVWSGTPPPQQPPGTKNYSLEDSLCLVMARPDIASREWFFRQKDSSVKGATILSPLLGLQQEVESDATIQKPLDTEGRDHGAIAYAQGIAPKLADIDPYLAAQRSFLDMVGKIIAVGGDLPDLSTPRWDAWAVCGNYCQPNSDATTTLSRDAGHRNLAALVREAIGVREAVEKLNIPVISGKDSMKCSAKYKVDPSFTLDDVPQDLREQVILVEKENGERWVELHDPPTYLASCAVKIEDYRKCVDPSFKQDGDLIYVVGTTKPHLGASQLLQAAGYAEQGAPLKGGEAPRANLDEFVAAARAIHSAIDQEVVASCSYVHNGGLATALAKAALAGERGAAVDIRFIPHKGCSTAEEFLYSETPGRFIVTVDPKDEQRFEQALGTVPYARFGRVINARSLDVSKPDGTQETVSLEKVKRHYQGTLRFGLQPALSHG